MVKSTVCDKTWACFWSSLLPSVKKDIMCVLLSIFFKDVLNVTVIVKLLAKSNSLPYNHTAHPPTTIHHLQSLLMNPGQKFKNGKFAPLLTFLKSWWKKIKFGKL